MPQAPEVLDRLRALAEPGNKEGMARFGIETATALGVRVPRIRALGKELGKDHHLAQELWETGVHEARVLACFVDVPAEVTRAQMESWAADFDSWDVVDQCCSNLFDKTPFAYEVANQWSESDQEFVKRAGFALMACLAVHDKAAPDEALAAFLPVIERESDDDRNFVKKAVNWALRQIGKRSPSLNRAAIESARRIKGAGTRAGRWIASDALRELESDAVQARVADRFGEQIGSTR
jgi:3-methyladenine DNA glycosylase AlkD